ncbi:FecR domain-containing protein [Paenibacillus apiarius]|nr:FecR domain-containing protein [Paenibacillus apiarius]
MKRIAACSLAFVFLFVTFIGPGVAKAADKAVRVALVKEWKGSVTVTKSGGVKPLQVFKKMSINQGDRIETGPKSRVVLQLAGNGEEDELTIGADADVSFTELNDKDGVKTRIGVLAGSVFAKVKSITGADDRFELETPTAVMAVRGTQFGVYVHPRFGWTQLNVAAGVVQAEYVAPTELGGNNRQAAAVNNLENRAQKDGKSEPSLVTLEHHYVYPSQSATFLPAGGRNIEALYGYTDIQALLANLDPGVLRAMIAGYAEAAKENEQYVQAWQEAGCAADYSGSVKESCEILKSFSRLAGERLHDQADENGQSFESRVAHNMKIYLAALVHAAVDSGLLTRQEANTSRIPWQEAALRLNEHERQHQQWVMERLEKWVREKQTTVPHDADAASQTAVEQQAMERRVQEAIERQYADTLSPTERKRFENDLKQARLEICENAFENAVCQSESSRADSSSGNEGSGAITPNPDPKPDPDPEPNPNPDPDPDPDPDPEPQPQAHVLELASTADHAAPNGRVVVDTVLKRLTAKLDVVAVEFAVEVSGGTLDTVELNDNKARYRHGGSKFEIAHHPDDYDKSNSVDSITIAGNRFVYRLIVTTSDTVSLESDDQILSLPYIAGGSGTMTLKLSEVRFYDASGGLLELNTMDKPLEIKVNP